MVGSTIGLYYNGARYLAAWLGRWTSADPVGIGADGPGLYNYTRGSPVNYTDPTGTERYSAAPDGVRAVTSLDATLDDTPVVRTPGGLLITDPAWSKPQADPEPAEVVPAISEESAHQAVQFMAMGEGPRDGGTAATLGMMTANWWFLDISPNADDWKAAGRSKLQNAIGKRMERALGERSAAPESGPVASSATPGGKASERKGGPYRLLADTDGPPTKPEVAMDTNSLIDKFERGGALEARVETARAGRAPVVSPTAAKEFMRGNPREKSLPREERVAKRKERGESLREFLGQNGGRVGARANEQAAQLREVDVGFVNLTRRGSNKLAQIGIPDQRVLGSAHQEGLPLLSRDNSLDRIMQFFNMKPGVQRY